MSFKVIIYFHRGYSLRKEYAPYGSIFCPLKVAPFRHGFLYTETYTVAPFRCGFLYTETYYIVQKLFFDDAGTSDAFIL